MPKYRESDADIDFYNKFKIEEKILQAEKKLLLYFPLKTPPPIGEYGKSEIFSFLHTVDNSSKNLGFKSEKLF